MTQNTPSTARPAGRRRRAGGIVKLTVIVTVLAVAAITAVAVLDTSGSGRAGSSYDAADMAVASVTSFDITTTATGELQARNQVEIRSNLDSPSTIQEIVEEGIFVRKGDVLVRLNADSIQSQIEEEELRVESARAELEAAESAVKIQLTDNETSLSEAELNVELSKMDLKQWEEGDDVKRLENLALALDEAESNFERLEREYEKTKELHKRQFISDNQLELEKIELKRAEGRLRTAALELEMYQKYEREMTLMRRTSELEKAIARHEKTVRQNEIELSNREATRSNRQRQLQMRERRLARLVEQYEAATIRAPSDGLVVHASSMDRGRRGNDQALEIGVQVWPNQPLIILPDTTEMVASVRVHESVVGRIRPGQPATVRVDALGGGSVSGRVTNIGVLAESGGWRDPNRREYTVRIALDMNDPEHELKPSMRCEAQVLLGSVADALAVPIQAVFSDGPVRFVYTPQAGKWAKRPVRVGRRSDSYAEITAGIEDGTPVLLRAPRPSEVLDAAWNEGELLAAGIKLDERGRPVPIEAEPEQRTAGEGQNPEPQQRGQRRGPRTAGAPTASTPTASEPANGGSANGESEEPAGAAGEKADEENN